MQVIKITTDNEISIVDVSEQEDLLKTLQKEVDGFIEIVRPHGLMEISTVLAETIGPLVMLVDEDGRCKFKEINAVGTRLYHNSIAGDILLCKEVYKEGTGYDLELFTEDEALSVCRLFKLIFNDLKEKNSGGLADGTDGI